MDVSKPAPVRRKLRVLEIGRFVAAFTVLLSHYISMMSYYAIPSSAKALASLCQSIPAPLAVLYFFVLSGFVMMSTHAGDFGRLEKVPAFLWRRACRIYPAYWLALGIFLLALQSAQPLGYLLRLAFLVPASTQELVSPAWSLRYEIAFYIAFSLCLLPYIGRLLLAFWVFVTLWCWRPPVLAFITPGPAAGAFLAHVPAMFISPFELFFFAGLLAGLLYVRRRMESRIAGWLLVTAGLGVLLLMAPRFDYGLSYASPPFGLLIGLAFGGVILGLAALERAGHIRAGHWAEQLGTLSYPTYILHAVLMFAFNYTLQKHHMHLSLAGPALVLFCLAYLITMLLIITAITVFAEQPVQRGLRRLTTAIAQLWTHPRAALDA